MFDLLLGDNLQGRKDHIAENATTINKIFEDSKTKLF